ncbi:MAG: M48 family metalloprotease [Candidatus Eisenbacteria bacterium]
MKRIHLTFALLLASGAITGCAAVKQLSTCNPLLKPPGIDAKMWNVLCPVVTDVARMQREYPAEEEYFLGQAVAAQCLASTRGDFLELNRRMSGVAESLASGDSTAAAAHFNSPVNDDPEANRYLNLVGQSLALYSLRPEIYLGYRFQILDTSELSALSSPGGHVLVSSGLLRCCESEDEIAAILAHEIAHVSLKHGVKCVSRKTWIGIGMDLAKNSIAEFGGASTSSIAGGLDGAVGDIGERLVDRGYDHKYEYEADAEAVRIMQACGYSPHAMTSSLSAIRDSKLPGRFAITHPTPDDRIGRLEPLLASMDSVEITATRRSRFEAVRSKF